MSSFADYFRWLRGQVDGLSPDLDVFFRILLDTKYRYVVDLDVNRALDGLALRTHFESDWSSGPANKLPELGDCTMLEFLVALANRINDVTYDWNNPNQTADWFWTLIGNLGIEEVDNLSLRLVGAEEVRHILAKLCANDYAPDGSEGGLFPLRHAPGDMRVTEIWYQMQQWLMESIEF